MPKTTEEYIDYIEWLIHESGVTMYKVSQDTGISASQLSRMKNNKSDVENMTIINGLNLMTYARNLKEGDGNVNHKGNV